MLGLVCCYYYESGVIQVIELCECGVGITGWCSGSSPVTHQSQYKYRITTIPVSTHSHPCIPRSYELKKNFNNLAISPSFCPLWHFCCIHHSLICMNLWFWNNCCKIVVSEDYNFPPKCSNTRKQKINLFPSNEQEGSIYQNVLLLFVIAFNCFNFHSMNTSLTFLKIIFQSTLLANCKNSTGNVAFEMHHE